MASRSWVGAAVFVLLGMFSTNAVLAAVETYKVDSAHSSVLFRIKHVNISYTYGRFNDPAGTITIDIDDPSKSSFEIELKVQKIDTGNTQRDNHLKNADFFNAKEFPDIKFKSTSVKKSAKGLAVTGDMTCHGVTKSVTVELEQTGAGETPFKDYRVGFEGVLDIKRSDFAMTNMIPAAGDEVRLMISLEAARPLK
jgi:polyisoprenoid-binding protein YceI